MNNNNEIRVKVNGGYLVAGRNADPNYDGIYIVFETDEGIIIDIVTTEAKSEIWFWFLNSIFWFVNFIFI